MNCKYCDPATSKDVWVTYSDDGDMVYPARIRTDYRWNGWAAPAFDFKTAMLVAADTHRLGAQFNDKGDSVEFASYNAKLDAFVMSGGGRDATDDLVEIYATSCCGRYDIGAMNWTWMETDEPEIGDLPQFASAHLTEV
jgi:hypothetical protein